MSASAVVSELASQMDQLRERGVTTPERFAALGAEVIAETIRWFDAQNGRVGAGVLVAELQRGGRRIETRSALLAEQEEYARKCSEWVARNFPDLCRPKWGPHPAAVAAVFRLHQAARSKGTLTVAHNGPEIRAAVRSFDERFGTGDWKAAA